MEIQVLAVDRQTVTLTSNDVLYGVKKNKEKIHKHLILIRLTFVLPSSKVSLNPAHGKVYMIQHYVKKFVSDLVWWSSLGGPVFSTNKIYRHYITEILLKVALNTISLNTLFEGW